MDSQHIDELARSVIEEATQRGLTVSTAESLTAGMVASTLAGVPGASAVLRGGAATYCDEVKHDMLGVSSEDLERYSAVSSPVAEQMAAGSRRLFRSDIAVSLTGYAGPGGGTDQDPVGTVYLGLASSNGTTHARCVFKGSRQEVRQQAVGAALELMLQEIVR